jgi:hypothetical protein
VRDPGAAHVFQAEDSGFGGDAFDVIAIPFEGEMAADRFESAFVEQFLELPGREVVGARQFDVLKPEIADLVECGGDIAQKLASKAVELKADGTFETRSDSGGFRIGSGGMERTHEE